MRRYLLFLLCLTLFSGCRLISSLLGIDDAEHDAINEAYSSPNERIQAEAFQAQQWTNH